jgi:hypothetical protein
MVLAKDSSEQYIIYRYGTKNKIELEFPEKTKESWSKFTYSYYLRGGGSENEGLDLNNVSFYINDFNYIIYDSFSASNDKTSCGIKIVNLITKKTINIDGNDKSDRGTLIGLRKNEMIKISGEIDE